MDHFCYYVLWMSCFRVCSLLLCGHLKGRGDFLALVCDVYCDFVTFPFGILRRLWYLIVSIPDPCCISYFDVYRWITNNIYRLLLLTAKF